MTLDELKAKLRLGIRDARAEEECQGEVVRRQGATMSAGSAAAVYMAVARARAESLAGVLRDLERVQGLAAPGDCSRLV